MQKQMGKIGAIRRELQGKACPSCGGNTYRLVLRAETNPQTGTLFARCAQCQKLRKLDKAISGDVFGRRTDEFDADGFADGRILWM